jgi:hypothetical protein
MRLPREKISHTVEHLADFYYLRVAAGETVLKHSAKLAGDIFNKNRGFLQYLKQKVIVVLLLFHLLFHLLFYLLFYDCLMIVL